MDDIDRDMRRALARCLPNGEPALGIDLDDVVRLGRRRFHTRRIVPAVAAVVTALAVIVPWSLHEPVRQLPATGATSPAPPSEAAPRLPQGHLPDDAADTLTTFMVDHRLPAERIAEHFGTRSETLDGGGRYGYGFHMLWEDGGRYGYLVVLHRTRGAFPATEFGLPAEPCAEPGTRLPLYHCEPVAAPPRDTATSFDFTAGYRMRGLIWERTDPAGGADIRVTAIFYLPQPGTPTPFPVMDTAPRLDSVPLTVPDLARLIDMPR
jgi:hypothetical protein